MEKNTGLKRILMAGVYALNGVRAAWRYEAAFRQETLAGIVALVVAFSLEVSNLERAFLISVTVLVMVVELVNSAIEAVVDRIGAEFHELSGRAKDMGSGAVLLSIILWVYVWIELVVLPRWF